MLWLLSRCLSGVFFKVAFVASGAAAGREPLSRSPESFVSSCWRTPLSTPRRSQIERHSQDGRAADAWRIGGQSYIFFFLVPPPVFSRLCVIPWQTDDVRWEHDLFRSGLPPPTPLPPPSFPSESCGLNSKGRRERWAQRIIRPVASHMLLQGVKITSWKNWHENDGVITNSFWKKEKQPSKL